MPVPDGAPTTLDALASQPSGLLAVPDAPPEPKDRSWESGRPYGSSGRRHSHYEHAERYRYGRARALKCGHVLRTSHAAALGAISANRLTTLATYRVARTEHTDEAAAEALERAFGLGPYAGAGECESDARQLVARVQWAQNYGFGLWGETWDQADGIYWLRRFETIYADSIVGWVPERAADGASTSDRVVAALQRVPGKVERAVPLDQVLYAVRLRDEGGSEGVALLRHVFPQFDSWLDAVRSQDVAVQRFAVATPVAKFLPDVAEKFGFAIDPTAGPDERDAAKAEIQAELDRMDAMLAEYTSHHRARLVLAPWFEMELFGGADQVDPAKLQPVIDAKERAILEAYLHGWMAAGRAGSGGSYNLVEIQREAALDAAVADVSWALEAINGQSVARFMRYNFSTLPRRAWPKIEAVWPQRAAFIKHMDKVMAAVNAGLLTPHAGDEPAVRAGFELPEMDDAGEQRNATDRLRGNAVSTARAAREVTRPSASDLVRSGRANTDGSNA